MVFDERQLLGRGLARVPVGVVRAALDVVDLVARERKRNSQPHKGFAGPQVGLHAVGRCVDVNESTGADRRGDRAAGLADVDDAAPRDMALERAGGLQFDFAPSGFGDRCQVAVEVVHRGVPFKLPIASEPSSKAGVTGRAVRRGTGRGGGSSRKSTVGEKNSPPVTAVENSRMRSVLPGGSPRNMFSSIRSVTPGAREYPMKYVPYSPLPSSPKGMLCRTIFSSVPSSSVMTLRATCELAGLTSSSSSRFSSFVRPITSSCSVPDIEFQDDMSCRYFWTWT